MKLIKLLCLMTAVSALRHIIDEEILGMPEALQYETMYGKSERNDGGVVEYTLTIQGHAKFNIYFIIGMKEYVF